VFFCVKKLAAGAGFAEGKRRAAPARDWRQPAAPAATIKKHSQTKKFTNVNF